MCLFYCANLGLCWKGCLKTERTKDCCVCHPPFQGDELPLIWALTLKNTEGEEWMELISFWSPDNSSVLSVMHFLFSHRKTRASRSLQRLCLAGPCWSLVHGSIEHSSEPLVSKCCLLIVQFFLTNVASSGLHMHVYKHARNTQCRILEL